MKLVFDGQQYDALKLFILDITNPGTETINDIKLVVWEQERRRKDWFVRAVRSDASHHAKKDLDVNKDGSVSVKLDFLTPGQSDSIILISKYETSLRFASRTKDAQVVDIARKRQKALRVASGIAKVTSLWLPSFRL
jgi:hypothetical protein